MTLFRYPEQKQLTREQIENHVEMVRGRRMSAAVVYFEGKNAKLQKIDQKLERRLAGQFDMLGKEIVALDKALQKVEERARKIEEIRNERGITQDQMVFVNEGEDDD